MRRFFIGLLPTLLIFLVSGCGQGSSSSQLALPDLSRESYPDLPERAEVFPGAKRYSVDLGISASQAGNADRLNIYIPTRTRATSLPCVFVSPAGATSFTGMELGKGDTEQCLAYAKAGFIVVEYEIDGYVDVQTASNDDFVEAIKAYRNCRSGLINATRALEFTLAKVKKVDPERLYGVGHSSGGRQALLWAAFEPRFKACGVYGAEVAVTEGEIQEIEEALQTLPQDFKEWVEQSRPVTHLGQIQCPVMCIHGMRDEIVPLETVADFTAKMNADKGNATFIELDGVGHFEVTRRGIPRVCSWLGVLAKNQDGTGSVEDGPEFAALNLRYGDEKLHRFESEFPVLDADYDLDSGLLFVAGHRMGVNIHSVDDLKDEFTAPIQRISTPKPARRVAASHRDGELFAGVMSEDGVTIYGAINQLPKTVRTFSVPEWKPTPKSSIVADYENPGQFLFALDRNRWRLDPESSEPQPFTPEPTVQPTWRYRYKDGGGTVKEPDPERHLAYSALCRLGHDGLTASFLRDESSLRVFGDRIFDRERPAEILSDVWMTTQAGTVGLAISSAYGSIQLRDLRTGEQLVRDTIGQVLPLGIADMEGQRGMPMAGARGSLSAPPSSPSLFDSPWEEYGERDYLWFFPDLSRQLLLVVTLRDIFLFDLNALNIPVIQIDGRWYEAPLTKKTVYADNSETINLGPAELVRNLTLDGAPADEKVTLVDGTHQFHATIDDLGTNDLRWQLETSEGNKDFQAEVTVQPLDLKLDMANPRVAASRLDDEHIVLWGSAGKAGVWTLCDRNAEALIEPQYPIRDLQFTDVALVDKHVATLTSRMIGVQLKGETEETPRASAAFETFSVSRLLREEGIRFHPYGKPRRVANQTKRASQGGMSQPSNRLTGNSEWLTVAATDAAQLESNGNPVSRTYSFDPEGKMRVKDPKVDPFQRHSMNLDGKRILDGRLWDNASVRLILDLPKYYFQPLVVRNGRMRFGTSDLILPESGPITTLIDDGRIKNIPIARTYVVERGTYQLLSPSESENGQSELLFVPHNRDQPIQRRTIEPSGSPSNLSISISNRFIWTIVGNRIRRWTRSWFESEVADRKVVIQPVQLKQRLLLGEKNEIEYQGEGATKWTLTLAWQPSADYEKTFYHATSGDGRFVVQITDRKGCSEALKSASRYEWKHPEVVPYTKEMRQFYQFGRHGNEPLGRLFSLQKQAYSKGNDVGVEVKALVTAEDAAGNQDAIFHSFVVPINKDLFMELGSE